MAKSQSQNLKCWQCGSPLTAVRLHVEEVALRADNAAIAAQRTFKGTCPTHGEVSARAMGNHSTILEKTLRHHLSKHDRVKIRAGLTGVDRKNFAAAEHGKYRPTPDDIARWRALLK